MNPNYTRSIVNISATLLNHYGIETPHVSLPEITEKLKDDYKHIVVMVLDGFGENLLHFLDARSILKKHLVTTLTSTFPSTTVAATTALLTAKTPYESGHLGWFQYVQPFGIHYTVFLEEDYYTQNKDIPEALKAQFAHNTFVDEIGLKCSNVTTKHFFPWPIDKKRGYRNISDGLTQLNSHLKKHDETLSYFYSIEPDLTQHLQGTTHLKTEKIVKKLNDTITAFYDDLCDDTLVIITADHGLIDVEPIEILNDKELVSMFDVYPAIEPRAATFFIKDNQKAAFVKRFNDKYGAYFELYTKARLLEMELLGFGTPHPLVEASLGNYFAIAKSHYYFEFSKQKIHKAHHAGLSNAEMIVPLILFSTKGGLQ